MENNEFYYENLASFDAVFTTVFTKFFATWHWYMKN